MFCQQCGKEVAPGTKFCGNCGAPVELPASDQPKAAPQAAYGEPQKQSKPKKKTNLVVVLIVVVIFFIIGSAIGNSMADSFTDGSGSGTPPTLAASSGEKYAKIFSDRNIVTLPAFVGTLDYAAYANVESNGNIDHLQFGYEGDTIVQMVETVYIPMEGWSDEDKASFDSSCRAAYAEAENLSFVSISYNCGYSYYSITVTMRDLDQAANIRSAVSAELLSLTDSSASVLSMSVSEQNLLAQGYAKK